jgi:hypothetical protein
MQLAMFLVLLIIDLTMKSIQLKISTVVAAIVENQIYAVPAHSHAFFKRVL